MNRRNFLLASSATSLGLSTDAYSFDAKISSRAIPSTNEALPCIGLGTSRTFDAGGDVQKKSQLKYVLKALVDGGGSVVDSSPMYGSSETVIGELASQLHLHDKLFMATKVWTTGESAGQRQMQESAEKMNSPVMDLMQVHNLLDTQTHMRSMRSLKEQGKIRYLGLSHYRANAFADLEGEMLKYSPDFIQINYSIAEPEAAERILPLAADKGIAVLINRPYARGRLFSRVRGQQLPEWVAELECQSWGQVFLKYILANKAVTCVIPGTSKLKHMHDNLAAGLGVVPNRQQVKRIENLFS